MCLRGFQLLLREAPHLQEVLLRLRLVERLLEQVPQLQLTATAERPEVPTGLLL